LTPVGDARALAYGIARLLNNLASYDRQSISQKAQEHFSYQAIGRQLEEVYRAILKKSPDGE